jgi:hypothetical protein
VSVVTLAVAAVGTPPNATLSLMLVTPAFVIVISPDTALL